MENNNKDHTREHGDFMARIKDLEGKVSSLFTKWDTISTRINLMLGGVAVSCILLVINLFIK